MAKKNSTSSCHESGPDDKRPACSIYSENLEQVESRSPSLSWDAKHIARCSVSEGKDLETGRSLTSSSQSSSPDARVAPIPKSSYSVHTRLRDHAHHLSTWPWWWEFGACIGSAASFLAIVGLLCAFDGKAQPDWPYGATLNSAVSWLSTITKGFLIVPWAACISQSIWINYISEPQVLERLRIYDEASRGPWGAAELIWALKGRCVVPTISQRSSC